jgi:transcriptional regulator with XRE-family HTH domain
MQGKTNPSSGSVHPATTYPALVGRVLKAAREQKHIDQAELASKVRLTQSTWSRIERGDLSPNVEQLALAARALGTTPGQILVWADRAANTAQAQGIEVTATRPAQTDNAGLVLVGTAAIALLVAASLSKS